MTAKEYEEKRLQTTGVKSQMNSVIEREICPFCGKMVIGDPWKVKHHVRDNHKTREKDFTPHFKAMIKHWLKK